jgi:hypothetical protein
MELKLDETEALLLSVALNEYLDMSKIMSDNSTLRSHDTTRLILSNISTRLGEIQK